MAFIKAPISGWPAQQKPTLGAANYAKMAGVPVQPPKPVVQAPSAPAPKVNPTVVNSTQYAKGQDPGYSLGNMRDQIRLGVPATNWGQAPANAPTFNPQPTNPALMKNFIDMLGSLGNIPGVDMGALMKFLNGGIGAPTPYAALKAPTTPQPNFQLQAPSQQWMRG